MSSKNLQKSDPSINDSIFLAYAAKSWQQEISQEQLLYGLIALQIYVDRYREIVRQLKSTVAHFIDQVSSKSIGYLNINEELYKNYRDLTDLYTFNHLDVKREIKEFDSKEMNLLGKIEVLFSKNSLPRIDPAAVANNPIKVKFAKEFEALNSRMRKLKLKNKILKKRIRYFEKYYENNTEDRRSVNSFSVEPFGRIKPELKLANPKNQASDYHAKSMDFDANHRQKRLDTSAKLTEDARNINTNLLRPTSSEMRAKSVATGGKHSPVVQTRIEFGNLQVFETNLEVISLKSDMNRQNEEINQLCKEIELIKAELKEKDREKQIIVTDYEKNLKEERDRSEKLIYNLKKNLEMREKEKHVNSLIKQSDPKSKDRPIEIYAKQIALLEVTLQKKDKLLKNFKQAMQSYLQEKRALQSQLVSKEKEVNELKTQINFLGKENTKLLRDRSELEVQNLELIEKFYAAAERENKAIEQYQKLMKQTKLQSSKIGL